MPQGTKYGHGYDTAMSNYLEIVSSPQQSNPPSRLHQPNDGTATSIVPQTSAAKPSASPGPPTVAETPITHDRTSRERWVDQFGVVGSLRAIDRYAEYPKATYDYLPTGSNHQNNGSRVVNRRGMSAGGHTYGPEVVRLPQNPYPISLPDPSPLRSCHEASDSGSPGVWSEERRSRVWGEGSPMTCGEPSILGGQNDDDGRNDTSNREHSFDAERHHYSEAPYNGGDRSNYESRDHFHDIQYDCQEDPEDVIYPDCHEAPIFPEDDGPFRSDDVVGEYEDNYDGFGDDCGGFEGCDDPDDYFDDGLDDGGDDWEDY